MQTGKTTGAVSNVVSWMEETLSTNSVQTLKEGGDAPADVDDATSLLQNYTEILSNTAKVSNTSQAVNATGITDMMAREVNKKLSLLKASIENKIMCGTKVAPTSTAGAQMNGLINLINSSNVVNSGSSLTVSNFNSGIKALYDSGCNEEIVCFVPDVYKVQIDGFMDVKYLAKDNFLGFTCDKYHTNWGDVTFVMTPSLSSAKSIVFVNPSYLELAELRKAQAIDLAVTGDSQSKMLVWEGSLKLLNSKAASKIVLTA
jgi:hypothetical protein